MERALIETIFFEQQIAEHPTTQRIRRALPRASWVPIDRYQELFNKRHQNFKLQKKNPALILAKKYDNFVLPVPSGFGMDSHKSFYFSHMYNCLYDCKYCFLQGMYSSANFVLFVNYEDFFTSISDKINEYNGKTLTFFSGYDCDSLAFDKLSGFADEALNFFSNFPNTELELRTKSIAINSLLKRKALSNCVVAFSLSPAEIAKSLDSKAPSISRRISAIKQLADAGWKIGLRFDPLIYMSDWQKLYSSLFSEIMEGLDPSMVHSISYGPLRFPKKMYKKAANLYPDHKLFAFPMEEANGVISYGTQIETQMHDFLKSELNNYTSKNKIFQCIT